MYRQEVKYYLTIQDYSRILKAMKPYMALDKYAGPQHNPDYTVRSIYLDTRDLKYYFQKRDGIKNRLKVRIRGYNNQSDKSFVFLELKRKKNNLIFKNRYPCLYNDLDRVLNNEEETEKNTFKRNLKNKERFLYNYLGSSLKPKIVISYEREAYYYKFNDNLRITFDKNIRSLKTNNYDSLFADNNYIPTIANKIVLEIKSSAPFPAWIDLIIKQFHLQRQSISKYALSMDKQYRVADNIKTNIRSRITHFI